MFLSTYLNEILFFFRELFLEIRNYKTLSIQDLNFIVDA